MAKTIIMTGGHAVTTAVATIEQLKKRDTAYSIHWIGAKSAVEGKSILGIENIVFPELGVGIHSITTGRLQKRFTRFTIPALFKIPIGIVQAFGLLGKLRPQVIVSFGGFAAFPVVLTGFLRGIPIILHEQTIAAGLANKVSSIFAQKIALAREESKEFFNPNKTVLTGNPVMKSIVDLPAKTKKSHPPIVFITLGSRGSKIVNSVIKDSLKSLVEHYKIIHLAGKLDFAEFSSLQPELGKNYEVYDNISPLKIAELYKVADIIIARAGANTISELAITKRPSILIPIPWTRFNEQQKNAQMLVEMGIATIIHQDSLDSNKLITSINQIDKNWSTIVKNAKPGYEKLDKNAAAQLADLIEQYLP